MTIQVSGATATPAQLRELRNSLGTPVQDQPGLGTPLLRYKASGPVIDFGLPADGGPAVVTWPTVPADAVGVELWLSATGSTDYLFAALTAGRLNSAGADLAAKVAANLAACRWVASGQPMVIPFVTKGVVPTTLRFATGNASSRIQGRFISEASQFPYLLGSTSEFTVTGANASAQLPHTDTNRFPADAVGCVLQLLGTGQARFTVDGTVPTATVGDIRQPGTYWIDLEAMGIAFSALRIFLPTGLNIVGHSLRSA